MRDGLYRVQFQTPMGRAAGVVVFADGTVRGGDSVMYYTGHFAENGGKVSGEIVARRHTPGAQSVFKLDPVTIAFTGSAEGGNIEIAGNAREAPDVAFKATLSPLGD